MEILGSLFACGGCFGFLPMALAAVALIDSIRLGAGWYWCMIILGLPVIGPIAYFVVVRSPFLGSHGSSLMSHSMARRLQARRRLKTLQVQLGHWRGPGVLAEAAEELLVLGKNKEAERHFLEAIENGAAVEDTGFGLAQALQAQGRFAEAVPYLEKLIAAEPDARLGEGPLALGRCLDESGRREEAEPLLRRVLERRTVIEAQVRLARILLHKGEKAEAGQLVSEVLADAKLLPRYLKRLHGSWIRAARRLRPGTSVPRPRVDGALTRRDRLQVALVAAGAVLVILLGGIYLLGTGYGRWRMQDTARNVEEILQLRDRIDALGRTHGWMHGDDLAQAELTAADVDRYLQVRRGLEPTLREIERRQEAWRQKIKGTENTSFGTVFAASEDWVESETSFLRSFVAELEREKMGPRELENLIALIEWRFLHRPEALVFALPEYERADWISARQMVASDEPEIEGGSPEMDRWAREERKRRARLKAKAAALEEEARAAVVLAPVSQALLESRRAELEALDPAVLDRILHGLDASLAASPWEE